MKALLIDPYIKTITEVEYSGDYKEIQEKIHANMFAHVRFGETEGVFINDEGLLTANTNTRFFLHKNWNYPVAGYGLVLGDQFGESVSTQLTVDDLKEDIKWVSMLEALQYPQLQPFLSEESLLSE